MKSETYYFLYKGENIIGMGTATELAKQFNIKRKTIIFYSTPANIRRHKNSKDGNYLVAVNADKTL